MVWALLGENLVRSHPRGPMLRDYVVDAIRAVLRV